MSFEAYLGFTEGTATIHLAGELGESSTPVFRSLVDQAGTRPLERLVLQMSALRSISSAGVRALVWAHQMMGPRVEIILVGARAEVRETIRLAGFDHSITIATAGSSA
ncbi:MULTISPECIES: STAS domain-containing protein [Actinoalloteichus]|uniref:Anti-sigma factor antagonist n=1 Tax=Actinoalloteichus fjordicus TaxID=1612552 RepID=A0AAC9LC21_9PSEU|nr:MULTISPECIES: STAS domain-containing protein [Actinoalloteichus]APU13589.1 anti-anti-sigma factor [Actinoalloteichus fjordicus]APU19536.1 anti-anti-sigma factor [Actinoalloteichus sp. GBA129-24]